MKTRLALFLPLVALAACTADNNASVKVAGICLPPTDATNCGTCGYSCAANAPANTICGSIRMMSVPILTTAANRVRRPRDSLSTMSRCSSFWPTFEPFRTTRSSVAGRFY